MGKVGDTGCSEDISNEVGNSLIFCKEAITTPQQTPCKTPSNWHQSFSVSELNRVCVFRMIEKNEPTTRY